MCLRSKMIVGPVSAHRDLFSFSSFVFLLLSMYPKTIFTNEMNKGGWSIT